jgi:F0F1-type ATP synthase membrane subunit b/b'
MSKDLIFGMAIIFGSLVFILITVLWSRKTIERIRKKKQQSAREIIQDIDGRK